MSHTQRFVIYGDCFVHAVTPLCDLHDKRLEYFCRTDEKLLCGDCLVEDTHRGHDTARAKQVLQEELELLRENSFEVAERMLLKMTVAVDDVRNMAEAVKEKGENTKHQIQKHFQEVKKVLRQREQALLETTDRIVMTKAAALNKQKDKLEQSKSELETHVRLPAYLPPSLSISLRISLYCLLLCPFLPSFPYPFSCLAHLTYVCVLIPVLLFVYCRWIV